MFQRFKHFITRAHLPDKPVLGSRSPQWNELRKTWLIQQPICQGCGTEKDLQVHHIIPVHMDPSKELDLTNLITLCEYSGHDCHYHLGHLLNWKAYNPACIQDSKTFKMAVETRPYALPPPQLPPPLQPQPQSPAESQAQSQTPPPG